MKNFDDVQHELDGFVSFKISADDDLAALRPFDLSLRSPELITSGSLDTSGLKSWVS